jgi:hypothetical protein
MYFRYSDITQEKEFGSTLSSDLFTPQLNFYGNAKTIERDNQSG